MKKLIIGGLVGGLILFIWQSLSWTMLNIHGSQTQYTEAQTEILACLEKNGLAEGAYFVPNVSPDIPQDQHMNQMQQYVGKPWAMINYHHSMKSNMTMNLIRCFTINVFAVLMFCYLLLGDPNLSTKKVFINSFIVGMISYLTFPYLNSVWFQNNSIPDLIDALVQWSLCGAFLAWYLPTKNSP